MKTLILLLTMMGQPGDKPDFSMIGPETKVVTIIKEVPVETVKTVEIPLYIMRDNTGQRWSHKDEKYLTQFIKEKNQPKFKQAIYPDELPQAKPVYGQDKFGRTWRAATPEELRASLDRANREVGWAQQSFNFAPQMRSFSSGSCSTGQCPR